MKAHEFIREEEKLDEILPLITGAASLAGGVMKGAGAVASGVGKGVGAAAKGVGKAIGAAGSAVANKITGNDEEEDPVEIDRAKDQMLRPGQSVALPTSSTGGKDNFKVTRVQGNEVEIENPNKNNPTEPDKIVYKKDDLKKSMKV